MLRDLIPGPATAFKIWRKKFSHSLVRRRRRVRFIEKTRLLTRLCENSSPAGDPGKTTSTVSIWRVFFGGEGSENPFFVLPKRHFGVFAQPVTSAATGWWRFYRGVKYAG